MDPLAPKAKRRIQFHSEPDEAGRDADGSSVDASQLWDSPESSLAHQIWHIGLQRFGIDGMWAKFFFILCGYIPESAVTIDEWNVMGGKPSEDPRALLTEFLQRAPLLSLCADIHIAVASIIRVRTHATLPPSIDDANPKLEAQFTALFSRAAGMAWAEDYATPLYSFCALHGAVPPRHNTVAPPGPYADTDKWMFPYVRRVLKDLVHDLRGRRRDESPSLV
jgi:hypothetical protein